MGNGSTKNERKANAKRVERQQAVERKAREEFKRLSRLTVNERPEDFFVQLRKQNGILKKARNMQRRSENDTQTGKRGRS